MVIKFPVSQTCSHPFSASDQPFLLVITCAQRRLRALQRQNANCFRMNGRTDRSSVYLLSLRYWNAIRNSWALWHERLRSRAAYRLVLQSNCEVKNSQKGYFRQCLTNLSATDATKFACKYSYVHQISTRISETQRRVKGQGLICKVHTVNPEIFGAKIFWIPPKIRELKTR